MDKSFLTLIKNIKNPDMTKNDIEQIRVAYELAEYLHKEVKRESGEPYIVHPLSAAITMANWYADTDTLSAALLHDVLEDTNFTFEDIKQNQNINVAILVDGVSKLEGMKLSDKQSLRWANERKLMEGFLRDPRINLLKFSDRLDNMRTIQFKKKRLKQIENALETLDLFVPLANYLGVSKVVNELSNLSLKCLDEKEYQKTECLRQELLKIHQKEIADFIKEISKILEEQKIVGKIDFRLKNTYQLYQRLRKNIKLQDIHDLFAIKVSVQSKKECYQLFDILQEKYAMIKEDTRDFIISPKENMYQSLHLGYENSYKTIMQIQIKTYEMHQLAEYGYVAFWRLYGKEALDKMKEEMSKKAFYKKIQMIDEATQDNKEFLEKVRFEIFNKNFVHVYTPKNDMFTFPSGATPIDFAYSIHTDLLDHISAVRVNDAFVPFDYIMQNGDRIQILCDNNIFIDSTYQKYAKTTAAERYLRRRKN